MNYTDWAERLKRMPKCKNCTFYDANNPKIKDYNGKIAICTSPKSERYKIGHYSVCCEFYIENEVRNDD